MSKRSLGSFSKCLARYFSIFSFVRLTYNQHISLPRYVGYKPALSSGILKNPFQRKADLFNQNYLFQTAFAIKFTLKPITGTWPKSPRPFTPKTCFNCRNLANIACRRQLSCSAHRCKSRQIQVSHHRKVHLLVPDISLEVWVVQVTVFPQLQLMIWHDILIG
jgi:hypothetical protein